LTSVTATTISPTTPIAAAQTLLDAATPAEISDAIQVIAENLDSLSGVELEAIVDVISAAPVEVKREFEDQVNIFASGLDNYVPADSKITVAERRVLVAVGAVLVTAPIAFRRR
jgi:hypothetical protein